MVWRSRTTPLDRVFACLVYLLPLAEAYLLAAFPLGLGGRFAGQSVLSLVSLYVPLADILLLPLRLAALLYLTVTAPFSFGGFGIGGFVIFILLMVLVVRNESIAHFVRFNTMQSIIVGIVLTLFSILWNFSTSILPFSLGSLNLLIFGGLFFGTVGVALYAIIQSALGKYAEIPTISNAAYVQVP